MTDWIERELDEAWARARVPEKIVEDVKKMKEAAKEVLATGKSGLHAPTIVAFKHPYVIVAGEEIEPGDTLQYGPWATWDSTIKRFVVPVYRAEE